MRRNFFLLLVLISLIILLVRYSSENFMEVLGYQQKSGIKITTTPPEVKVFLNGGEVGKTPYQDQNLKPGEYDLKLDGGEGKWLSKVELLAGTLTVVNRELSGSEASSSGEILTLSKGQGVVVTSQPPQAIVEIDGKVYGQTPVSVAALPPGEHVFLISYDGYLKRSIRAMLPDKMILKVTVDLALSETELWNISNVNVSPTVISTVKLTVKSTPNGFLRMRDQPSTKGVEVSQIKTGESLVMLEDSKNGWFKVRTTDGQEGYVSSQYIQKQP